MTGDCRWQGSELQTHLPVSDLVSGWTSPIWRNVHSVEDKPSEWIKRQCRGISSVREHFLSHLVNPILLEGSMLPWCCWLSLGPCSHVPQRKEVHHVPCPCNSILSPASSFVVTISTCSNPVGSEAHPPPVQTHTLTIQQRTGS